MHDTTAAFSKNEEVCQERVVGAWPFLVGGVICLVNSDNEQDLNLLK